MEVNFKYEMDENIIVNFGKVPGVITMLGFDDGGIQYYVVTADKGLTNKWWKEKQISKV